MRRALWAAVAVVALVAVALGGLVLLRGRLERSEGLRQSLEAAAASQLGVRLDAGPVRVGPWTARLRLARPELSWPDGRRLALSDVQLDVDARALLDGVARVRSVAAEGPARLELPRLALAGSLQLQLQPDPGSGAWRLEGRAVLDSGGVLEASGTLASAGAFEGELRLEGVDGAPFASLLARDPAAPASVRGRFDGRLEPGPAPAAATLRLRSEDAEIRIPPVRVAGPVALVARLPARGTGAGAAARQRFAIDATRARVEYAGAMARGTGDGASVEGWLARDADGGVRAEDVALRVQGFRGGRGPQTGAVPPAAPEGAPP